MRKKLLIVMLILCTFFTSATQVLAESQKSNKSTASGTMNINVVLKTDISANILKELGTYGTIMDTLPEIDALTMNIKGSNLNTIRNLDYVSAANTDAIRNGIPIDMVQAQDFSNGLSTWNLDAINVTNPGSDNRQVLQNGDGVYVAVLDTGLVDQWRQYFPEERIAHEYANSFSGSDESKVIAEQPNKWEHDQNSHGTHVTSTILGYSLYSTPINGVAPKATVIPVKVLNQNGSGWSSVIARGITYIADLKKDKLSGHPVVINMSLGGPGLDAMEKAAIDYAIASGVIIVAAAGNEGTAGMGYPGAYEPVISVAASGWTEEWTSSSWWYSKDVADQTDSEDFYITDFSSRQLPGQDLDIAAPGSCVVGPYQLNSGKTSYYFLGGTSMASPHVAGIVALMAQKYPDLIAGQAESILEARAIHLDAGSRTVNTPYGPSTFSWGADATGAGLADAAAAIAATP